MLFVNIACILYKISPLIKYYAKGVMQKGGQTPRWFKTPRWFIEISGIPTQFLNK